MLSLVHYNFSLLTIYNPFFTVVSNVTIQKYNHFQLFSRLFYSSPF